MNCPVCHHSESRVIRTIAEPDEVWRQRRCAQCGHPWQTVEQAIAVLEREREIVAKARELAQLAGAG